MATGVRDDARKKAILLHLVGSETQEIYDTLGVADTASFDQALTALNEKFDVQKNVSYERSVFHMAKQQDAESIEQYVTRLRTLVKFCEYGDKTDEHIRDQVIATCLSSQLRRQLLSTQGLTLTRVREMSKMFETSSMLSTKLGQVE